MEEVPQLPVMKDSRGSENKFDSNLTVSVSGDVCGGCHMSGKPFIPQAMKVKGHTGGGAYCLTCHTDDCSKCHSEIGADKKWEKRLTHFRTIVRT